MGMQLETESADARYLVRRILFTVVWLPIQLTLSMIFATGGILIVLSLGILLSPILGLVFLIRRVMRGIARDSEVGPMRTFFGKLRVRGRMPGPARRGTIVEPDRDDRG